MQLTQKGKAVEGSYGAQGWGTVEGEVRGRRLHFTGKRLQWSGKGWLEQTPDGARVFGLTDESPPVAWIGIRLKGFDAQAKPRPGEFVQGRAKNGMLYFLRVPKSWKKGTPVDTIVLLHGSNWTTKGMVHVVAERWPDIAERFAILGLQGEQWASFSELDDLRFNYTYVNWMGRSTYQGYPYTDRESPTLVVEVLDELKSLYGLGRLFVGGHSQGGFLTFLLHMHYPEKWAGTFPMAGNLVIQAEPDVFKDEKLLAAQRATPIAIVHGRQDNVVEFSAGEYCRDRFLAHGFPLMRFFAPDGGHPFDFLPVGDVVRWLDVMSGKDAGALLAQAQAAADAGDWRAAAACVVRAKALRAEDKLAAVAARLDAEAGKAAATHLAAIEKNADGSWVDAYLEWQDAFEGAPAAQAAVAAFKKLQSAHDPKAEELMTAARKAFNEGKRDEGWQKYQEIVDACYAAKCYRTVKRWLANRR
jgi:predicted esterase